jgi:hypothetical protein
VVSPPTPATRVGAGWLASGLLAGRDVIATGEGRSRFVRVGTDFQHAR